MAKEPLEIALKIRLKESTVAKLEKIAAELGGGIERHQVARKLIEDNIDAPISMQPKPGKSKK